MAKLHKIDERPSITEALNRTSPFRNGYTPPKIKIVKYKKGCMGKVVPRSGAPSFRIRVACEHLAGNGLSYDDCRYLCQHKADKAAKTAREMGRR
jgi:hypothetical protein